MEELLNITEISVSYKPKKGDRPKITTSSDAVKIARMFFPEANIELQERFIAMYLNRANRVIGVYLVSIGGITGTVVDPRLILGVALKVAACSIILAHNHPSGSLQPSRADEELTHKIREGAKYMDIKVLDHMILSPDTGNYYSFADEGII